MKAKELANILMEHPEHEVIIASDAEGNSYSPIDGFEESSWDGESVGLVFLDEAYKAQGYTEEDVLDGETVFVIYPV
jgi:hypothetical protein